MQPLDPITTKALETIVETVVKGVMDSASGAAKEQWKQFKWHEAAKKYRERLKERYGTLQILGKPKPIALEGVFTEVYVLEKITAWRRYNVEELHAAQQEEKDARRERAERRHAWALAKTEPRLFVLGKPGAGKSTFLKYLTLQADKLERLPIFISLNEWAESGQDLLTFMEAQFEICAFPEAGKFIKQLLKQGRALVLFDGLDEVNEADDARRKTLTTLKNFTTQYVQNHFVVTCRVAASNFELDKFTYVEVADFTDEQVAVFAQKWFNNDPKKGEGFLVELGKNDHRGLRELTRSPLLLTLLCLNYDETLVFPARRVEIYEEAVDALLKKWDSARRIKRDEIYKGLSLGRKRQLLAHLAADYFGRGQIFFALPELAQKVEKFLARLSSAESGGEAPDGEAVVQAIAAQHGLLVERARGIYSFSHLTLQEYFTARYIAENGTWLGMMTNIADDRWREVFLLTASLLPEEKSDNFFAMFRQMLDGLIAESKKAQAVLCWGVVKANDYVALVRPAVARMSALALVLARIYFKTKTHNKTHLSTIGLSLTFLGHASDFDPVFERVTDPVLVVELMRALDRTGLGRVIPFSFIRGNALDLNLPRLAQALENLKEPLKDAPETEWRVYADALRALMIEHRNIGHDWQLNPEDKGSLEKYEYATLLFAECLQLAVVDNRRAIEETLLLPPGQWVWPG